MTEDHDFDDLLAANRGYAENFTMQEFDGVAHAGVAMVTCMDSRIDPLRLLGLKPGDAKIFRNPGGRVTEAALEAIVLGVHLLGVNRILVVPHTRCAIATSTLDELRDRVERVRRRGRLVADLPRRRGPGGGAARRRPHGPHAPADPRTRRRRRLHLRRGHRPAGPPRLTESGSMTPQAPPEIATTSVRARVMAQGGSSGVVAVARVDP